MLQGVQIESAYTFFPHVQICIVHIYKESTSLHRICIEKNVNKQEDVQWCRELGATKEIQQLS